MKDINSSNKTTDIAKDFPLRLARSQGGVKETSLEAWDVSFGELCESFSATPAGGDKDGPYYVRGPVDPANPTRSDDNILAAYLVVLDGDRSVDANTGAIVQGSPPAKAIHDALVDAGIPHVVHTTHSHGAEGKGCRTRTLIPAFMGSKQDLEAFIGYAIEQLHQRRCLIADVSENHRWPQPWYYPRMNLHGADYECYFYAGNSVLPLEKAQAWQEKYASTTQIDVVDAKCSAEPPRDTDSLPARFNALEVQPEAILARLQKHGYRVSGSCCINDQLGYRLLCPNSTSGNAGVVLFSCTDGTWRVYSHHGSDPLNERLGEPRARDAFDVYRILEHNGDHAAACSAFARSVDHRPKIQLLPGKIHEQVIQATDALSRANPHPVFQRGSDLVRVAHASSESEIDGIKLPSGTASILPVRPAKLRTILSEGIYWERFSKKSGWQQADPSDKVVSALIDNFGHWDGIPVLRGISECPILRPDGTLHTAAGYDDITQLYVEGRVPTFELPAKVTREVALASLQELLAPFAEFPFVDQELDRACLVAYMFTLALRSLMPTAPLFGVSATTPGTGKGLLIEVANRIVRGRDAAVMPPVAGRDGEDEMRKRITSLVAQGISSINLDNYSRPLGGDSLNALLTTTEWTDRQLGTNTTIKMPVCTTLAATGNNLAVRGDMVRRSILILLDANVEHPEHRTFQQSDLIGDIRRKRQKLLQALFTILKAYQQSGCSDYHRHRLGRFETWSELVCHPIMWLGLPDPVESQKRLQQADPEMEKLSALFYAWYAKHRDAWIDVSALMDNYSAVSLSTFKDTVSAELEEALLTVAAKGRNVEPRILGWYLKRNLGRICDGYRLEREDRPELEGKHAHRYRIVAISGTDSTRNPTGDTQ